MVVPKKGLLQTHYTVAVTYSQNRLHIVSVIKTATRKTVSIAWFFCSAWSILIREKMRLAFRYSTDSMCPYIYIYIALFMYHEGI